MAMPKITPLKAAGPYVLGRQSGGYVVQDTRTGNVTWYTDKATATRVFTTKLANVDHSRLTNENGWRRPAPVRSAAEVEALYVLNSLRLRDVVAIQHASARRLH